MSCDVMPVDLNTASPEELLLIRWIYVRDIEGIHRHCVPTGQLSYVVDIKVHITGRREIG